MILKELSRLECTVFLAAARMGHLGCSSDGQPYIVPITFAFADNQIYSFSLPGQKVEWMRKNPKVCLQVEEVTEARQWKSVVVSGTYEELPDRIGSKRERDHAWSLLSKHANWWEPGALKPISGPSAGISSHLFYRLRIETMSGRQAVAE